MPQPSALALLLIGLLPFDTAQAKSEQPVCRVLPFRGATSPQGADAEMHVVNTGQPCSITNFGVPSARQNPADSGRITSPPSVGVAEFKPPRAVYLPKAGFDGEDYFEYEATAKGPSDNPLLIRVRVKVTVKAP